MIETSCESNDNLRRTQTLQYLSTIFFDIARNFKAMATCPRQEVNYQSVLRIWRRAVEIKKRIRIWKTSVYEMARMNIDVLVVTERWWRAGSCKKNGMSKSGKASCQQHSKKFPMVCTNLVMRRDEIKFWQKFNHQKHR